MSFDPYAPYGPVVESTVRVVTWNVWGRYGSHQARQALLEQTLARARPDVICLVEAWQHGTSSQPGQVARRLELPYHHFAGDWRQDDWVSGILVRFIGEVGSRRDPVIVCGDFNAGPDCDEIRMLTGRAAPADPRMVFYDSWEMAGNSSPGCTWSVNCEVLGERPPEQEQLSDHYGLLADLRY